MHLLSVIMPVYNVEKYIADSVQSICKQSIKDFELILVDDGCTDNSIQIAEKILIGYDLSYKIIHQENKGQSSARNTGIAESCGEWVICIDSDDCIHPKCFEVLLSYIYLNDVDVISFGFQMATKALAVYPDVNIREDFQVFNKIKLAQLFLTRQIKLLVPALLIRKKKLTSLKFCEACRFSEDQLFIWELISKVNNIIIIPHKMYYYHVRPQSIMTASGIDNIMTGYNAFISLTEKLKSDIELKGINVEHILPRWIIGTLHSASKHFSYKDFKRLNKLLNGSECKRNLIGYQDRRIMFLASILSRNEVLFYLFVKMI